MHKHLNHIDTPLDNLEKPNLRKPKTVFLIGDVSNLIAGSVTRCMFRDRSGNYWARRLECPGNCFHSQSDCSMLKSGQRTRKKVYLMDSQTGGSPRLHPKQSPLLAPSWNDLPRGPCADEHASLQKGISRVGLLRLCSSLTSAERGGSVLRYRTELKLNSVQISRRLRRTLPSEKIFNRDSTKSHCNLR